MSLIKERASKFERLTTKTSSDRVTKYRGVKWSIEEAIQNQVNKEDDIRYQTPEFVPVSGLPYESPTKLSLFRFINGILP